MPYEGEFAQHRSLFRLAQNERVRELLGSFEVQSRPSIEILPEILLPDYLPASDVSPSWVLAVDGSHLEVRIENGYPQAEASYVTVASVLLDLEKVRELDQQRPVEPHKFRETEHTESIDCAMPSCNVVYSGDSSARESLRRSLFAVFADTRLSTDSESLLETYESLLAYKPTSRDQHCPYDDCPGAFTYSMGAGCYPCVCSLERPVYSTDALRIHEGMNLEGTNGAMFAEVMQVWERVWIVHFLRTLERRGWLSVLRNLAIVLDGPLAVFGHPAWLSHAISRELCRLNDLVRVATDGSDLLLLGIEKTGTFVQHFEDLDRRQDGRSGRLQPKTMILLDDPYIKNHIIFSGSDKPYGLDTYFGRKLLYKTLSGARIVACLPFLSENDRDVSRADPSQYPRLADAISVLDQLVSSRYPNSLNPLVAAHAEAAIPLSLGTRILEQLARKLVRN